MTHPYDPPRGSELDTLLGTIYYLGDCLSDLAACLLPFDGPIDDRIDYAECRELFNVASATTSNTMLLLARLLVEVAGDE
jgi:hypothetical protein